MAREKILVVEDEEDILDLMLPGMDGTEVCKTLKQEGATRRIPIIILSAKGEEMDRVIGLELGAADYVTKPFSPRELILRVKAVLQRGLPEEENGIPIQVSDLTINIAEHQVYVTGKPIELTHTEFKLLAYLLKNRGRVQDRESVLAHVWGYDSVGDGRTG